MRVMWTLLLCLLLCAVAVPAAAQDVAAPIHQFLDGFNSGDTKSANAALVTGDMLIVDEVAPFSWSGPNASQQWAADLDKHESSLGITDGKVKYSAPTRSVVEGDTAYVIVPTAYLFNQHGKPMSEEAQMTFVLHKQNGAWKIAGWVWTGVEGHPAK